MDWDVVIVGAGPAGLSAALVLGRACRRVLLCDTGTPRSWASKAMHAYLSRDGISPARFLDICRREVLAYPAVRFKPVEVSSARRLSHGFSVTLAGRARIHTRKLQGRGVRPPATRHPHGAGDDGMVARHRAVHRIRDVQLSIVAAAEGAHAAFGINRALTREDFERRARARP